MAKLALRYGLLGGVFKGAPLEDGGEVRVEHQLATPLAIAEAWAGRYSCSWLSPKLSMTKEAMPSSCPCKCRCSRRLHGSGHCLDSRR